MNISTLAKRTGGSAIPPEVTYSEQTYRDGVDFKLTDENPVNKNIWSNFAPLDEGNSVYNAALWGTGAEGGGASVGGDLDFSGICFYKNTASSDGHKPVVRMTAITRRHVICAKHVTPDLGTVCTFIKPDGGLVTRTIDDRGSAPVAGSGDLRVLYLDEDLPAEIASYRIFHPDVWDTLNFSRIPVLMLRHSVADYDPGDEGNNQWQANVWDIYSKSTPVTTKSGTTLKSVRFIKSVDPIRLLYKGPDELKTSSGCPVFCVRGTTLIFLGALWYGGYYPGCASPNNFHDELETEMSNLGPETLEYET